MRLLLIVFVSFSLFFSAARAGEPAYAFAAGFAYTGWMEFYEMDADGSITLVSKYNIWKDYPSRFGDPAELAISPRGDALFLTDFNNDNGAIYGISDKYALAARRRINDFGCIGEGFTWDGAYAFSTKGVNPLSGPPMPVIQVYDMHTSNCMVAKEIDIPTTAALSFQFMTTTKDEIISSASTGFLHSPPSMIIYQFDRKKLSLTVKDYLLTQERMVFISADNSREILLDASGHYITSLKRQEDGTYQEKSRIFYWPDWMYAWGYGGVVTPDGQYAVAIMFDDDAVLPARPAGAYLFKVTPEGELVQQSLFFQKASEVIGMTPDGKYIVVSSNYGTVITVFRINREKNELEVVHTMPHPNSRMQCMAFFPNKRPKMPVQQKNWSLYSDGKSSSQKIAQKATSRKGN